MSTVPLYVGIFQDKSHGVGGEVFLASNKTVFIQQFTHDGLAPNVVFLADGVRVPYISR